MTEWSPTQYLQFEKQRTQPAVDLAARVADRSVRTAVDVGCGPGNSTAVLRRVFPKASLLGVDLSPEMVEKAANRYPIFRFEFATQQRCPDNTIWCFPTPACSGFRTMTA